MSDQHTIDAYTQLFRGRGDAYGTWEGGSIREPLTKEHFARHLTSANPADWIGVYPHLGNAMDQHVTWGCVDIDGKDFEHNWDRMWALARKLHTVLAVKDIHAHLEETANGIHIWVFPERGHCPAVWMRRSLMAACKAVGYDPKEVNPKSEELAPGKLGNYVRLPYYAALSPEVVAPDRYMVNHHNHRQTLQEFLACVRLTALDALEATSKLWTPPVQMRLDGPPPDDVANVLSTISGLAHTIWKNGPLEGRDRSNTLAKLAYTLRDEGITMPSAFAVVRNADERWGKHYMHPITQDENILKLIQLAYHD